MKDSGVVLAKKGFSNDIMNLNLNTSTKMANNNAVSNIKSTAVP